VAGFSLSIAIAWQSRGSLEVLKHHQKEKRKRNLLEKSSTIHGPYKKRGLGRS